MSDLPLIHDLIELRLGELSDRIRRLRDQLNLTMVELSQKSGVSPSTIHKIETRQMVPSIAILFRIATGLGVEPTELVAPSKPAHLDMDIQRAGDHIEMRASEELNFVRLSGDLADSALQVWRTDIAANFHTQLARPQRFDELVLVGLKGRIEIDLDHQIYVVGRDESMHCKSKTMYSLRNPGRNAALFISAARYPGLVANRNNRPF